MIYHSVAVGEVVVEARIGVGAVAVRGLVGSILFVNKEHYYQNVDNLFRSLSLSRQSTCSKYPISRCGSVLRARNTGM